MAYGLRVLNDDGVIQIDENYSNFMVTAEGSGVTANTGPNPAWYIYEITVTGNSPLLSVQSTEPWTVLYALNSGSSFTYTIMMFNAAAFDWWVFDIPSVISDPGDDYGLRVNKSDASLAFHSGLKIMRIEDQITVEPDSVDARPGASAFGSYTSGRSYALIQSSFLQKQLEELAIVQDPFLPSGFHNYVHYEYFSFMTVNAEVCTIFNLLVQQTDYVATAPADANYAWGQSAALVVDVTNY